MINILNLPSLTMLDIKENDFDYHFTVETVAKPSVCPCCGRANIVGYGRDMQLFMDTPMHGKRLGLHVKRRRLRCNDCSSTFFEPLDDMDEKRFATRRLIDYIENHALYATFTKIAGEVGVNEWTVRSIFKDYMIRKQKSYHPSTPRFLGIDEAHLFHHYRCVLANVEKRTIIDLLPNRNASTVAEYLRNMPQRSRIEIVCMDMWQPYRDTVRNIIPEVKIVIDKFHIVQYASDALDAVRKEIRKSLTERQRKTLMHDRFVLLKRPHSLNMHERLVLEHWLTYPLMKLAYELKEGFYNLFDNGVNRQVAELEYDYWLKGITPEINPYFEPLTRAVENWYEEIFSYFELKPNPVTNAYTESLNNLIKLANKNGSGYKFDVLRAKVLFTNGLQKITYPKFNKRDDGKIGHMISDIICEDWFVGDSQIWNHGVDIYTLMQKMEDGSFFSDPH
jgi:transposase